MIYYESNQDLGTIDVFLLMTKCITSIRFIFHFKPVFILFSLRGGMGLWICLKVDVLGVYEKVKVMVHGRYDVNSAKGELLLFSLQRMM